jgi:hypothetical protein
MKTFYAQLTVPAYGKYTAALRTKEQARAYSRSRKVVPQALPQIVTADTAFNAASKAFPFAHFSEVMLSDATPDRDGDCPCAGCDQLRRFRSANRGGK